MKKQFYKLFMPVLMLVSATCAKAQIITTIAGDGTQGFGGDNGVATLANLSGPTGIACDASGNVYVCDDGNHRIRRINTSGIISTIAGNGTAGSTGDGAAATAAELFAGVGALTFDTIGNLYLGEGNRIRQINTSGIINTIAGTGTNGFSGDNGLATSAEFSAMAGIAIGYENQMYICDGGNNRIRIINTVGIISTIAGNGTEGYTGDGSVATNAEMWAPLGIAVDPAGNVFFSDYSNNVIRKINASGIISTVVGNGGWGYTGDNGPATAATLSGPQSLAIDAASNLYFVDQYNYIIRKVNNAGIISTVAGNGTAGYTGDNGLATAAQINTSLAGGIAVDASGNIFITDPSDNVVRKISAGAGTGVNKIAQGINNISVYPNPNKGQFAINGALNSNNDADVSLEVSDMFGRIIYSRTIKAQKGIVDAQMVLPDLADGLYILNMRSGSETNISRIVIEK